MWTWILALHVTAVCLVVGTLFVQSLAVIFRLRLKEAAHVEGARWIQYRIYLFIYHPILIVAIGSGFYLAMAGNAFQSGKWLHWKLVGLMLLIGFGLLNGRQIKMEDLPKPFAMMVHIGIFLTTVFMIYLVVAKPF